MRIVYGVMGYGRGHATRTATVLPDLMRDHEVLVLAGGDAFTTLTGSYPVVRIPTLGYVYGRRGKRSTTLTLKKNLPAILDLFWRGPSLSMVIDTIREFAADVIISDAEAWTQRAGKQLGIPRITFDHFGILTHCKPKLGWQDRWTAERDRKAYLALMGQPERVIVSSFYNAPPRRPGVRVIGPLIRDEVRQVQPTDGDHLLVYLNNGIHQFTDWVERALQGLGRPVKIYGTQRIGTAGNLSFHPPSKLPFLEDLASCQAVISTAGNQLVGEAMHLGKPLLVMPEHCVEQRCNANALEDMCIGEQLPHRALTTNAINRFLEKLDTYKLNIRRHVRDGNVEAIEALNFYCNEIRRAVKKPDFIRKVS